MHLNSYKESSSSHRSLAGERRVVTILFSDVKGSTAMAEHLDPEDWAEIMNEAFEYLTKPIVHYGGTVARLMGDAVLAFFGAPHAHEDDPLRAVLAGLDIIEGIQSFRQKISSEFDLDFNVRVGINTGRVVVGEMGSALAGEYTAMGDAVNLAARMEQTAKPGTVQITNETYRLVAPWIDVEELGGTEVKGKSDLVFAYCVLGRKVQPSRARGIAGINSPLVGRDQEFFQIESAVNDLLKGQGRILTLIGEAGIGKSRLIEDLHTDLEQRFPTKYQWIETRGISYESSRPYGLFVQALRQLCKVDVEDAPEIIRQKVSESFRSLSLDQQSGISQTVELLLTDNKDPEVSEIPLQGEARKRKIFESVLNIWSEKAKENPIIMVFDDLHWADSASVELIYHIFQLADQVPILYICAFRPHRDSAAWRLKDNTRIEFSDRYSEIMLAPLDRNNSGQLVDNILVDSNLPSELRINILRKSEGNPFFLEEVIRTLIDKGVMERTESGNHWRIADSYEEIDIPDNLQALLLARIDRLESSSRHILQLASVIGRSFNYRILKSIAGDIEDLEDELERLQNMDLILETTRLPEVEYIFRHELTRDAAYQSILRRQRREYHREVGSAIESLYPEKLAEEAHTLAYHFNAARDYPNALKYYQIAGGQSLKLYANQEASEYYHRAVEIALKLNVPSVQLAKLYSLRGRTLELLNQFDRALDNYEDLEELGRTRNDRSLELAALIPQTIIYSTPNVKFNPQVGKQLSRRALNLAIDLRDYEAEAKALWSLMLIQTFSEGDLEKGITYGEQGLRIAREHDLREVRAHIQHDVARLYMRVGRLNDSWEAYQSSQSYWREIENLPMLADNLASLAESYYTAGDFDRSMIFANEGLRISDEIGNVWGQAYNYFVIGPILLERGEIDDCLETLDLTLDLSRQANFAAGIIATQMIKSWLYVMFGDLERAVQFQSEILSFVEQYDSFKPLYLVNQAQNKLYAGESKDALSIFEKIDLEYRTDSELIFHPNIYTLHVEIHLANQDYKRALETVGQYLDILNARQVKILLPDLLNQKARALIGLGRVELAQEELQAARRLAMKQESRRIHWAILLDMADIEKDKDKASELREEARNIIEYISTHLSDKKLLETFHHLPKVKTAYQKSTQIN
jgi:class 3 adenylate cyclase/tetratricopeptide (TPR) repeat protein